MTTTIEHVQAPSGRLTVFKSDAGTMTMPGFLGATEVLQIATAHFLTSRRHFLPNDGGPPEVGDLSALGAPRYGRVDPGAGKQDPGGQGGSRRKIDFAPGQPIQLDFVPEMGRPGVAAPGRSSLQGRFRVDRPEHGAMWIARKYNVSLEALTAANRGMATMLWNGRRILDLQIGDIVTIPAIAVPRGYFYDINFASYRPHPTEGSSWRSMMTLGAGPEFLGGDDECSTLGVSEPYDGNSCTSNAGRPGSCNGGSCIEIATTGVPNHTPGAIPNPTGDACPPGSAVDPMNSQFCVLSNTCPSGQHWDLVGNTCCPDGQVFSTGSGSCVVVAGGIQGTCLPYSPADANGYCVDIACPPGTHRTAPGEDCIAWDTDSCNGAGGIYDPNGPGGESCFAACQPDEAYNFTYHSCYCKAPLVRDANGTSCVQPTVAPPSCPAGQHPDSSGKCIANPPPPTPTPCPTGTVPNAPSIGNAPGNCVTPVPQCPGGGVPDANGKCAPPATGAASSSNTGIIIGALALLGLGTAAVVMSKKKGGAKHARA